MQFKEGDIVTIKYNDMEYIIIHLFTSAVAITTLDHKSGYDSYPIKDLTFVSREFYDPEEIMA